MYIDITYPINSNFPKWPKSVGYKILWHMKMPIQPNNLSSIEMDCHLGTHLDAPLHFIEEGKSVEQLNLDNLLGIVYVVEIRGVSSITSEILESANIPIDCERLILKTDNQQFWEKKLIDFQYHFSSIDASGAEWIVKRKIKLIGIDYLSIQRYFDGPETHQILLRNEVVIVESLNLENVMPGKYKLICLPIKLESLEGAPVRAILEQIQHEK